MGSKGFSRYSSGGQRTDAPSSHGSCTLTDSTGIPDDLLDQAERDFLAGDARALDVLQRVLEERGVSEDVLAGLAIRRHCLGLERAERWKDSEPSNPAAWRAWAEALRRAHRLPESTTALQQAIAHCPDDLVLKKQIAERYLGARCYPEALQHVESALQLLPTDATFLRIRAELLSRTHSDGAARAAADAWDAQVELWPLCTDIMLRAGEIAWVRERLEHLRTFPEHALRAEGALARLGLWEGDPEPAIAAGQALIDADPTQREGYFLRGAGRAYSGVPGARDDLEKSLSLQPHGRSWLERSAIHGWLCDLALEEGELDTALRQADLAMSSAEHYSANALLARHRVIRGQHLRAKSRQKRDKRFIRWGWLKRLLGQKPRRQRSGPHVDPRWKPVVLNYGTHTESGPATWESDHVAFGEMLAFIHAHIGGNRSSTATWRDDEGTLHPIAAVTHQHIGTRSIQQQLRCRPHSEVEQRFRALCERFPTNPEVHTYGGEVLVWLGDHSQAEPYFRAALEGDFTTVWAWIGLGAARGLQGHLEEALEIFAEGIEKTQFEGPSVFVYRGEFHRLLGNRDDAARDLDKAVQHKPQRLSAWINRVLLDAEMGEVAPLHALTRTLKRTNPGLWCDAAESVGADPTDLNQSRAVMNATLALMKGNRSSQVITYRLANGALRFAKWTTACAPEVLRERYGVARPPA